MEERLNEVMAWFHKEAGKLKTIREEQEEEARLWAERQRQWEVESRLRREEEARVKKLEEDMTAWRKAERIRAFVAAVEQAAVRKTGTVDLTSEAGQWLSWAKKRAATIDPIKP